MNYSEEKNCAAKLVESVLLGERLAESALEDWPNLEAGSSKIIDQTWTCLRHFADDSDIFENDKEYYLSQRQKLTDLVSELRR